MWIFVSLAVLIAAADAQSPPDCPANKTLPLTTNTYLLSVVAISPLNAWDGPKGVTNVSSTTNDLSWSEADLQYYNYFSASVYCPTIQDNLDCCLCGEWNSTVSDFAFVQNDTLATLAMITVHPSEEEIVVTFRGSVALTNWVLDLTMVQDTVKPRIKIHHGFYLCLMSVYDQTVDAVTTALNANPTFRIVVNGHSLGGSMASLFVYFVKSRAQFPSTTTIVLGTFGQPRVGNKAYADYMNSLGIQMGRVVSRADLGPHIIPVTPLTLLTGIQYVHHTQEIWTNGAPATFCSKSVYEDWTCSNSLGPAYQIVDHLSYFNVDYSVCYLVNDALDMNFLSIPGAPPPSSIVPQAPPAFYNYGGQLEHVVFTTVSPFVG